MKKAWHILKDSVEQLFEMRILKLSAALAYYTIFSIPGLMIVVLWIGDVLSGHDSSVRESLYSQIESLVGESAKVQIETTIKEASNDISGKGFSTVIGLATLIFGATSIFAEIQDSINMIWRLKTKPKKGRGWLKLIVDRLLSFSMVVSLGFLLLVSLLVNGIMDIFIDQLTRQIPETEVTVAYISNLIITFLITSFLFGLIFKVLPDARIRWRAVRAGAFVTAILFMLGKFLISYYLGHNKMTSAYGAAGSIIVILLWVYYSAVILYFGAAFTRVYSIHNDMNIFPSQYAVWVEQVEVEHEDSIQNLHNDKVVAAHEQEIAERTTEVKIETDDDDK
ncbi:YihY/virulence factor BrkB family protein [Niabella ginsengisoli]|uniref:YihY/virulence factor BrkB family protein n=1 Tax=Niabella ginsengisoli TaxID=522298 RepID=A0ABS9SF11_9BACT|nr:YihY/virulence factor BrkB family protein [Niabella ginsengisoli]MCH5596938.1 YihY/virulence factor BrkB family protein [Niabella ginsengisoli]